MENLVDRVPSGVKDVVITGFPDWNKIPKIIFATGAFVFFAFSIYTGAAGVFTTMVQRPMHLLFMLFLFPFLKSSGIFKEKSVPEAIFNAFLAVAGVVCMTYIIQNWVRFYDEDLTAPDMFISTLTVILVLEFTRRAIGLPLVIIAVTAMFYAYFGSYLPGAVSHRGYSFERIINMCVVGTEGIFGIPLGVAATFIILFIYFAAFLQASGAVRSLMGLAMSLSGRQVGGPAKMAVVGSSMMGTISGSTVANVTSTGSITIPLMIASGYPRHVAGAIEACASMGGSFTPPIMGATGFVIAQFLGVEFFDVILAAIIPAVLFYTGLFAMVHNRSIKLGMRGMPKSELPPFLGALSDSFHVLIPLGILVYLLYERYTPMLAAFYGLIALLICANLRKKTRTSLSQALKAIYAGARMMLQVTSACAAAGIVIAMLNLSGLGHKLGYLIIQLSGGSLLLALFLVQIAAMILGMGLVTVASYTLLAVVCAKALVDLGASEMGVHMFIFYFSLTGTITPPVMLAGFAAAAVAEAPPFQVGFSAVRFGLVAFIIPYMFVYSPSLLMQGPGWQILLNSFTAVVGVVSLASALEGYLYGIISNALRVLLLVLAILLVVPHYLSSLIGLAIFMACVIVRIAARKKENTQGPCEGE
ncbi:MAG: TRAP transporter fused permease subunit [Deltaproteobacteria bacterium]|nr:TRAP transporter fused permease subunit [Deltaproteobacteria bacterium]